jgi:hypothetical protein
MIPDDFFDARQLDTGREQVESYRLTGERDFGYVLLHIG